MGYDDYYNYQVSENDYFDKVEEHDYFDYAWLFENMIVQFDEN